MGRVHDLAQRALTASRPSSKRVTQRKSGLYWQRAHCLGATGKLQGRARYTEIYEMHLTWKTVQVAVGVEAQP